MSFLKPPKPAALPPPPPPPPTIDAAAQRDEFARKVGRRKGSLATMFAGGSAPAPQTAVRTALGNGGGG